MIAYIDGPRLRRAISAGVTQLLAEEDLLNRINVFPVPDGDTGTNLALTARAMVGVLRDSTTISVGESLQQLADAALDGSRGNSGAILAQFLHGLSDAAGNRDRLTPTEVTEALAQALTYARDAIERPRKGTMLTIFEAMHAGSAEYLQDNPDAGFAQLVEELVAKLEHALQATKYQLEALTKANVVDAGAAGIVAIVQGIDNLLRGKEMGVLPDIGADMIADAVESSADEYQFCTECIVTGSQLNHRQVREALAELGNSMVVAGGPSRLKLHIHTDNPEQVFDIAGQFGSLTGQKADDMRRQAMAVRADMGVAVITDSAGDLPEGEAERLNIHTVPLRVHIGEYSYLDKVSLSFQDLYQKVAESDSELRTSQPPPGDFRRMYEYLDSHFEAVLSVQLSDKVSGTLQAARTAIDRLEPGHGVKLVNSRNVSLGQGLLTLYAGECAAAGLAVEDIAARLEQLIPQTRTFAIVTDLSYAVRGGRVPRNRKTIADLLRVTPILRTDAEGNVKTNRILLGRRNAVEKFARYVAKQCVKTKSYRVAVGHGNDPGQAWQLSQALLAKIPNVDHHYVTEVGAALGVHGGPGMLVVAVQPTLPID